MSNKANLNPPSSRRPSKSGDEAFRQHYNDPITFNQAIDSFLKTIQAFADKVRNHELDYNLGTKLIRTYATQAAEFTMFQRFGADTPQHQYAIAIASLSQEKGSLQPKDAAIDFKDLTLQTMGTYNPSDKSDFWLKYNAMSNEDKNKVNECILHVLKIQEIHFRDLKCFKEDSQHIQASLTSLENIKKGLEPPYSELDLSDMDRHLREVEYEKKKSDELNEQKKGLKELSENIKGLDEKINTIPISSKLINQFFKLYQNLLIQAINILTKGLTETKQLTHSTYAFLSRKNCGSYSLFFRENQTHSGPTLTSYTKHSEENEAHTMDNKSPFSSQSL